LLDLEDPFAMGVLRQKKKSDLKQAMMLIYMKYFLTLQNNFF